MSDSKDVRPLFLDYAQGLISAENLQALEVALREDSHRRRDFIEYMNIDSALDDLTGLTECELSEFESTVFDKGLKMADSGKSFAKTSSNGRPATGYFIAAILGVLASTLLIFALLRLTIPGLSQPAAATLIADISAVLLRNGQPCKGIELRVGNYQLEQGLLRLQFHGKVMVYVEAPAGFDIVNEKRIMVHRGRVSATVPPEGIGFTVDTPEAEVVDYGTEFSVEVENGASEVHVFEGLVRVKPRSRESGETGSAIELETSQAVKIEGVTEKPIEIALATDRFIRTFDESRRRYAGTVKQFEPLAFYRMAIRDQGLSCVPKDYSGVVLTGTGKRPPHASGVFAGGSLRVMADSTGRGGRVDSSPPLQTGHFTLCAFLYPEANAGDRVVATNIQDERGNFSLALNEFGCLNAIMRTSAGELVTVSGTVPVRIQTWCHVVMTVDGKRLCLYEDGLLVASSACNALADSLSDVLWFGTDANGLKLWDGRIDEVALFDRSLSDSEVTELYQTAVEEMQHSQ